VTSYAVDPFPHLLNSSVTLSDTGLLDSPQVFLKLGPFGLVTCLSIRFQISYVETALKHHSLLFQVIMQLWLITVYVVDGFANAGTIVGSDLAGRMESSRGPQALFILFELRKMTRRLLLMGNGVGVLVAVIYFFGEERIISAFTYDEGTKAQLRMVWPLLTLVQPLNATVSGCRVRPLNVL
jgi:Na+-driven multidrug efflux pump